MKSLNSILASTAILAIVSQSPILSPASLAARQETSKGSLEQTTFQDFAAFRSDLLSKIGSATKRVWIATDFFSDGEIVSSLFIAQYRKINVSVLLGKDRATNILSRLNYLKQNNIPVALRPKPFYPKYASLILVDNQVFGISSTLDHTNKASKPFIETLPVEQFVDFEHDFSEAAKLMNAPSMAPLPQVGRVRPNGRYYKPNESLAKKPEREQSASSQKSLRSTPSEEAAASTQGSIKSSIVPAKNPTADTPVNTSAGYRYRSGKEKPGEGVPTKLPRTTLRQELEKERERLRNSQKDEPSTAE